MKWIGIILIMTVPSGYAIASVSALKNRVQFLERFIKLIHFYKQSILYEHKTIDEFCKSLCISGEFSSIGFESWTSSDKPIDSLKACIYSGLYNPAKEDRETVNEFINSIGTTDIEGQINNCEMYHTLLFERFNIAKESLKNKEKLYYYLGAFGSLFVLIILW